MRGRHPGDYLETALQLFSEIEEDGGVLPVGTCQTANRTVCQIGLPVSGKKQMVCALYQLAFLLPYDACGRQIFAHTTIPLLGKQRDREEKKYENKKLFHGTWGFIWMMTLIGVKHG